MKQILIGLVILTGFQASAATEPTKYILTITNGSAMPLSPISIYTENGQLGKTQVGEAPTPGFVQLCQTGNPATRVQELSKQPDVTYTAQTMGMTLPGQSQTVEIDVQDPLQQSIHFEGMYGKTKDVCAVGEIGGHLLSDLKQHVTSVVTGKDNVLATGAFLDPAIPIGHNLDGVCSGLADAVSCLRSLAAANMTAAKMRFFPGYLSSVQILLENNYGAADTQSLIIPTSGGVQFQLKLKH